MKKNKYNGEDRLSPEDDSIATIGTVHDDTGEMRFSGNLFHGIIGTDMEMDPYPLNITDFEYEGALEVSPNAQRLRD